MKRIVLILCINIFIGALGYNYGYYIGWNTELEPWGLSMLTQEEIDFAMKRQNYAAELRRALHRRILLDQVDKRMVLFQQSYSKEHIEKMLGEVRASYQGESLPVYRAVENFYGKESRHKTKKENRKWNYSGVDFEVWNDEVEMRSVMLAGITKSMPVSSRIQLVFDHEIDSYDIVIRRQEEELSKNSIWGEYSLVPGLDSIKTRNVSKKLNEKAKHSLFSKHTDILQLPNTAGRYQILIRTSNRKEEKDTLYCNYYFFVQLEENGEIS